MKTKLVDKLTVELCRKNKDKIFIFGDNIRRYGKGGQAIIRDCPNAYGIATKRKPSMAKDSFFSDQPDEIQIVEKDLEILRTLSEEYTIVFPVNGIGTGLAKLKEKSPIIYQIIKEEFENYYKVFTQ